MKRESATPRRRRRLVDVLAVIAGGGWGALAGGMLVGLLAAAIGVPVGTGEGELFPAFGWNRFTAFIIGLPIGFAAGAVVALRAARRWPSLVGLPLAMVGALVVVSSLADSSGWDTIFWLLIVPVLPGIAFPCLVPPPETATGLSEQRCGRSAWRLRPTAHVALI